MGLVHKTTIVGLLPETIVQRNRIVADGGTVVDIKYIDRTLRLLKGASSYSRCKFLGDANMGVKLNGSGVTKLYDLSGNNNDATQGTVANQPVWTANVQGGRAGIVFDGNDTLITPTVAVGAADFTMGLLVKRSATPDVNDGLLGAPANYAGLLMQDSSGFSVGKSGVATGSSVAYAIPQAFVSVLANVTTGTTADIYINGSFIGTSTDASNYTLGNRLFNIGCAGSIADLPLTGTIINSFAYSGSLTTAQRTAIERFLNAYFSIY